MLTVDVYVAGINKKYHRKVIGKELLEFAEHYFYNKGYKYMMVKIGWIEYNLKRALGIESNSEDECQLGYQQVLNTVKSIRKYEEQKESLWKLN